MLGIAVKPEYLAGVSLGIAIWAAVAASDPAPAPPNLRSLASLEPGYVGNRGVHMDYIHLWGNQAVPGLGSLQPAWAFRAWKD
jgi:hypothetical protein